MPADAFLLDMAKCTKRVDAAWTLPMDFRELLNPLKVDSPTGPKTIWLEANP